MSDQDDIGPKNHGLSGILKMAFIIAVLVLASLLILLTTDIITTDTFNSYFKTMFSIIGITTLASLVIALLIRSGNK